MASTEEMLDESRVLLAQTPSEANWDQVVYRAKKLNLKSDSVQQTLGLGRYGGENKFFYYNQTKHRWTKAAGYDVAKRAYLKREHGAPRVSLNQDLLSLRSDDGDEDGAAVPLPLEAKSTAGGANVSRPTPVPAQSPRQGRAPKVGATPAPRSRSADGLDDTLASRLLSRIDALESRMEGRFDRQDETAFDTARDLTEAMHAEGESTRGAVQHGLAAQRELMEKQHDEQMDGQIEIMETMEEHNKEQRREAEGRRELKLKIKREEQTQRRQQSQLQMQVAEATLTAANRAAASGAAAQASSAAAAGTAIDVEKVVGQLALAVKQTSQEQEEKLDGLIDGVSGIAELNAEMLQQLKQMSTALSPEGFAALMKTAVVAGPLGDALKERLKTTLDEMPRVSVPLAGLPTQPPPRRATRSSQASSASSASTRSAASGTSHSTTKTAAQGAKNAPRRAPKGKAAAPPKAASAPKAKLPPPPAVVSGVAKILSNRDHALWKERLHAVAHELASVLRQAEAKGLLEAALKALVSGVISALHAAESTIQLAACGTLEELATLYADKIKPLVTTVAMPRLEFADTVLAALVKAAAHKGSAAVREASANAARALISAAPSLPALEIVAGQADSIHDACAPPPHARAHTPSHSPPHS